MSACCMKKPNSANFDHDYISGQSITDAGADFADFTPLLESMRFASLPILGPTFETVNGHIKKLNVAYPDGFGLLEIDTYLTDYCEGRENSTIRNLAMGLKKAVLRALGLRGRCHSGKVAVIDETFRPYVSLKRRKARRKVIGTAEVLRVIAHAPDHVSVMVEFLFYSALRVSELCALRLEDFEPEPTGAGIKFTVRNKGGDLKTVTVRCETYERARQVYRGKTFLFEHAGQRFSRQGVGNKIRKGTKRVLGRAYSPHAFRHAHADFMYRTQPGKLRGILSNGGWVSAEVFMDTYNHQKLEAEDLPPLERIEQILAEELALKGPAAPARRRRK